MNRNVTAIRLCRINKQEDLLLYEPIILTKGYPAVDTILRRSAIAGHVEVNGDNHTYFADLMDKKGESLDTVSLDAASFRYLKNKLRPLRTYDSE